MRNRAILRVSGLRMAGFRTWVMAFLALAFAVVLLVAVPQQAFAHASLTNADPAPESVLETDPGAIRLKFNQRLESGLASIRVTDESGLEIETGGTELSEDGREVLVALPSLGNGSYTVDYRVLSADGHTVSGSYVFHVQKALDLADSENADAVGADDSQGTDEGSVSAGGVVEDGGHVHDDAGHVHDDMDHVHDDAEHHHAEEGHHHADAGDSSTSDSSQVSDSGHHHAETGGQGASVLLHGVKTVYYIALLLFAGLALWRIGPGYAAVAGTSGGNVSQEGSGNRRRVDFWLLTALRVFLLALIGWIGVQLPQMVDGLSREEWPALLGTSIGRMWGIHLALALVGLVVLGMQGKPGEREKSGTPTWQRYLPACIALIMLATKATSSHAAATDWAAAAMTADFVHLLMGALWVGGLLILLVLWRNDRERVPAYLKVFSRFAWISILVLAVTGYLLSMSILPDISYLFYSSWGTVLLVKVAAVLIVIPLAGVIRQQMKRRGVPAGKLVATDFGLALAIVVLAAVLSGLQPVPANKPLHWHVMGSDIHMTAEITPNEPGVNRFVVKVWLPEPDGEPESVRMQLVPVKGGEEQAPIDIPLAPAEDLGELEFFPDFTRYDYAGEGGQLAFPGEWAVRVLVTSPGGNSYVFTETMRVY